MELVGLPIRHKRHSLRCHEESGPAQEKENSERLRQRGSRRWPRWNGTRHNSGINCGINGLDMTRIAVALIILVAFLAGEGAQPARGPATFVV